VLLHPPITSPREEGFRVRQIIEKRTWGMWQKRLVRVRNKNIKP
jgi:hypothetical protein